MHCSSTRQVAVRQPNLGSVVSSVARLNQFSTLQRSLGFHRPYVLGVAVFDLSGLPMRCFGLDKAASSEWVDTAFNALCLESLLKCGLNLQGFQHLTIQAHDHHIVLVKQLHRYFGLLVRADTPEEIITHILSQLEDGENARSRATSTSRG